MADDHADTVWIPAISRAAGPVYLAISDAIEADIRSGHLSAGRRLPPQRALAETLDIDFTTVTRAYAEARKRGLVEGRVGQGTYVCARRAVPASVRQARSGLVDMSMNLPPRFDNPALAARMWEGVAGLEAEEGLDLLLRYQQPGGAERDRAAGAAWLSGRLPNVPLDRILVCPGAQGALLAVTSMLAAPGDIVCAEMLTYPGFRAVAAHLRLDLVGVAMDKKGLIPEAFEEICIKRHPKALYCNPTLNNPTTITLSLDRRRAIAEIAARHDVAIIEDDAYGALPEAAVQPFAAIAPLQTYHIAGLAKCLSPALRIAYLVAPDIRVATRLAGIIRATAAMASPLSAAIASRWIEESTADAVLAAIRAEARKRQTLAAQILPENAMQADPDGFHGWLLMPPAWSRGDFTARLRVAGVGVVASDAFALGTPPEAVRLGLGAADDIDHLKHSLGIIADLLSQSPAASALIV
jgi:DNA-binding transcriptional MocR family regulator